MLDFIYWPVSWIMRLWYKLFEFLGLGSQSAITWILAVVFLVFTLRAILYWPAVKQIRTTRQMQELQPQIKALQKKYKNDRQRMAVEMQKLQKEHGFNPMLGCLPMLAQAPVFIGLFHVLRSFNRTGTRFGQENVCANIPNPADCANFNASLANYAFSPEDVSNFLHANIFGVPLSSYITQPVHEFAAFTGFVEIPSRLQIAVVAVPLMIVAAIATHLNAKASVARQSPEAAAQQQAKIMNKLAVYIFPLGVLVSGSFLPVAILIYWVSNNGWTVVQQHYVFKKIGKEEDAKKERLEEVRSERAPKPGARPTQGKKSSGKTKPGSGTQVIDGDVVEEPDGAVDRKPDDNGSGSGKQGGSKSGSGGAKKGPSGSQKQQSQKQPGQKQPGQKQPGQKPKPGAQAQKPKASQPSNSGGKGGKSGNQSKGGGGKKKGRR